MASNFFGKIFRITTFGESHGKAIGVVIDGCPAGVAISKEEINLQLSFRQPGNSPYTSPRKEADQCQILSGTLTGITTGAPIALLIENQDVDSSSYQKTQTVYKPGHAHFTYLHKYGIFDSNGGGRASARETVARVAAGAIAKKFLQTLGIECVAFVCQIGTITCSLPSYDSMAQLREKILQDPLFCPDEKASLQMQAALLAIKAEKDSLGGVVGCFANPPLGLGDPVYNKLEAALAYAMLSIPATKGFEIGEGFQAAQMKGSEHNDPFAVNAQGEVFLSTNHCGGTLGGISTGSPLFFKVALKPPSSIQKPTPSVTLTKEKTTFQTPETSRHDPCVAIRAVPVIEAMTALTLADAVLMNRLSKV